MKNCLLYLVFKKFYLIVLLYCFTWSPSYSQDNNSLSISIMFYNVENLFDTWDDTLKVDEEFLPAGDKHWTYNRYNTKIKNLYKTIVAVGGWDSPALIGLCEIENRKVLNDLIYNTPLSKLEYRYEHFESPDRRGIDVALLYNKQIFKPVHAQPVPIRFPKDSAYRTRDILYVKGVFLQSGDTIHLFINHWPSRRGGQLESEPRRILVAETLREKVDSLIIDAPDQGIIVMGDFNDQPENQSLLRILKARLSTENFIIGGLYNLDGLTDNKFGSYKYRGAWNKFDQIIVSGNLLTSDLKINVDPASFEIFHTEFLLIEDEKYLGSKPFSTYSGYRYKGGFSDHLPVKVELIFSK